MQAIRSSELPEISGPAAHFQLDPHIRWVDDAVTYPDMPPTWVFGDDQERYTIISADQGSPGSAQERYYDHYHRLWMSTTVLEVPGPYEPRKHYQAMEPMTRWEYLMTTDDSRAHQTEQDVTDHMGRSGERHAVVGPVPVELAGKGLAISALANYILASPQPGSTV